ncbi:MAG: hypothetical protein KDB64_05915, partial [Solirubrobacterales bacterium]|nr:hypothetical protein [Solirubrobacterales bacterium]
MEGSPDQPPTDPEPDQAGEPAASAAGSGSGGVTLEGVTKQFGDFTAVHDMDLDIADGEFFTMLGPSGCGKT